MYSKSNNTVHSRSNFIFFAMKLEIRLSLTPHKYFNVF